MFMLKTKGNDKSNIDIMYGFKMSRNKKGITV